MFSCFNEIECILEIHSEIHTHCGTACSTACDTPYDTHITQKIITHRASKIHKWWVAPGTIGPK